MSKKRDNPANWKQHDENEDINKVKMIMIVYQNGDKQFFNNYKYRPSKDDETKSKGIAEVKKIDKANPTTFEELVEVYENVYN